MAKTLEDQTNKVISELEEVLNELEKLTGNPRKKPSTT